MKRGQIHHVEYYVDDLKESNRFWDWFLEYLGYEKYQEWPKGISWSFDKGTYLVFVQTEKDFLGISNNRMGSGLNHIAFSVASLDELKQLESELIEKKVHILKSDEKHICFEDGNKFAVELFV